MSIEDHRSRVMDKTNLPPTMKFRKKPVVIEAVQWFKPGDHPKVIKMLDTAEGQEPYSKTMEKAWGEHAAVFYAVQTLEGNMRVSPGDWIITGVKGEQYPCKPDIFAQTYEPAEHMDKTTLAERLEGAATLLTADGDEWGVSELLKEAARAVREAVPDGGAMYASDRALAQAFREANEISISKPDAEIIARAQEIDRMVGETGNG